jgi:hypothetical protein
VIAARFNSSEAVGRPSVWVRVVQVVLLLNALPAFIVLTAFPGRTADLFVWTVKPEASARLLAAMYGNAAVLALLSFTRRTWAEIRVTFVVFTLFALAATIVTFFHLDPFLAHPRYFFVYWLVNYFFLFFSTPVVFAFEELARGGRVGIETPLSAMAFTAAALAALACLFTGISMFVGSGFVNHVWPWPLTPLVARIIGVWMTALAAAYVWALWDRDARRTKPIFVQGLPTAVLLGVAPLLQSDDVGGGAGHFILFAVLVATLLGASVVVRER